MCVTLAVKEASYPADKVDARGLSVENCAVCHGKNGRAHTFHGRLFAAQNLTNAKFQADTTDEEIIKAIKTGSERDASVRKETVPDRD